RGDRIRQSETDRAPDQEPRGRTPISASWLLGQRVVLSQGQASPKTGAATASNPVDPIEMAGKIAALMAALLPAGGFVARIIALEITFGPGWAFPIAWSAPLPQLAVTGLICLAIAFPAPAVLWLLWHSESIGLRILNRFPSREARTRLLIAMAFGGAVGLLVFVALFLFLP